MTQTTAIVVHRIFDTPEMWKDQGDHITDGYYKVALDGSWYSMGEGRYGTVGADRESFVKAIAEWKDITGWQPKAPAVAPSAVAYRPPMTLNALETQAHKKFERSVRSSLSSFHVHKDSGILSLKIQEALNDLDMELHPMHRVPEKPSDAKGS